MTTTNRLTGLDGLRGVAAAGIVVLHAWMYRGAHDPTHSVLLDAVIGELRLGVTCFFVLSGFLLARAWVQGRRPALGRYALHRAARLLPAYWVALLGALLVFAGTGHPRGIGLGQLPIFLAFAQNQFEATAGQLNPPTWSLGVEVSFYAALPLIGWLLMRARPLGVCALLIAGGVAWCGVSWAQRWPATLTTSLPTYLPVFACGIAAAVIARDRTPGRRAALALLLAGWGLVVLNGLWHSRGDTGLLGHSLRDLPAAAGFAAIVLGVTARPAGVLDTRPLRWLGDVSYGTYLWHMPVLYWLVTRDALPDRPLGAAALVLAGALALGTLSFYAVERPVLRRVSARRAGRSSRRRTRARPSRAAAASPHAVPAVRS